MIWEVMGVMGSGAIQYSRMPKTPKTPPMRPGSASTGGISNDGINKDRVGRGMRAAEHSMGVDPHAWEDEEVKIGQE